MLSPKKVKYRKMQKGKMRGTAERGGRLSFGQFGLQALECGFVSMTRHVKRGGKMWIRVFPDKPISKKPAEVRMGKGKGAPEAWVAVVKPGRILYEMEGVSRELAREALRLAAFKLPVKTRFVERSAL